MTDRTTDMDSSGDLRSRMVALEHQGANREQRLSVLEAWRTQRDIDSARHDERWKSMDERFRRIESALAGVHGTLNWIMRIVIGGILMGVVAFMIKGGFAPP